MSTGRQTALPSAYYDSVVQTLQSLMSGPCKPPGSREDVLADLAMIEVDLQNGATLLINFSDGTFATFSVGDLALLHPRRTTADGDVAAPGQDYL